MAIVVFDTETTSLEKPFCYNVGYIIYDETANAVLMKREFIIEQIWHNLPLFASAYYADKRPLYVDMMRKHQAKMDKWGYVCQAMARDFEFFDVTTAYAYNAPFDIGVFNFNCDWFKTQNPFEGMDILDIRGYAHHFICDKQYETFCEDNGYITEGKTGYSTSAETVYRYISGNTGFIEDHTALSDSTIELGILCYCVTKGAKLGALYPAKVSVTRKVPNPYTVCVNGVPIHTGGYVKKSIRKDKDEYNFYE